MEWSRVGLCRILPGPKAWLAQKNSLAQLNLSISAINTLKNHPWDVIPTQMPSRWKMKQNGKQRSRGVASFVRWALFSYAPIWPLKSECGWLWRRSRKIVILLRSIAALRIVFTHTWTLDLPASISNSEFNTNFATLIKSISYFLILQLIVFTFFFFFWQFVQIRYFWLVDHRSGVTLLFSI